MSVATILIWIAALVAFFATTQWEVHDLQEQLAQADWDIRAVNEINHRDTAHLSERIAVLEARP